MDERHQEALKIGQRQQRTGMATILKATTHPDQIEQRRATAMIFRPEPVSRTESEFTFLIMVEPAHARRNWRQCFFTICTAPPAPARRWVLKANSLGSNPSHSGGWCSWGTPPEHP